MNNNQSPEQKPEQAGFTGKQPQTNENPSGAPLRLEPGVTGGTEKETAEPEAKEGDDSE